MPEREASMVAEPVAAAVPRPVASIAMTAGSDDAHVASDVRSCDVPSVNVPVAVNCCLSPFAIVAATGVTEMLTSAAGVTVRLADPDSAPAAAVMIVEPICALAANPEALMAAVVGADDDQATDPVMSSVVPFVYVPVATNCCEVPSAIEGDAGVTVTETRDGAVTVSVVDPLTVPEVAVIAVIPSAELAARPPDAMVAVAGVPEDHTTLLVRLCVVPSV